MCSECTSRPSSPRRVIWRMSARRAVNGANRRRTSRVNGTRKPLHRSGRCPGIPGEAQLPARRRLSLPGERAGPARSAGADTYSRGTAAAPAVYHQAAFDLELSAAAVDQGQSRLLTGQRADGVCLANDACSPVRVSPEGLRGARQPGLHGSGACARNGWLARRFCRRPRPRRRRVLVSIRRRPGR